jgi:hypothetical protein
MSFRNNARIDALDRLAIIQNNFEQCSDRQFIQQKLGLDEIEWAGYPAQIEFVYGCHFDY